MSDLAQPSTKPSSAVPPDSNLQQLQNHITQLQQQVQQEEDQLANQAPPQSLTDDQVRATTPPPVADPQPAVITTRDKERKDALVSAGSPEVGPVQEIQETIKPPEAVRDYIQVTPDPKMTIPLRKPVEDEYGDILMQATQIPKPKIILPFQDKTELQQALHRRVWESVRWIAEWAKRVVLLNPGRVFYKPAQ